MVVQYIFCLWCYVKSGPAQKWSSAGKYNIIKFNYWGIRVRVEVGINVDESPPGPVLWGPVLVTMDPRLTSIEGAWVRIVYISVGSQGTYTLEPY